MKCISNLFAIAAVFVVFAWSSPPAMAAGEVDPGQSANFSTPNGSLAPIADCGGAGNECDADAEPSTGMMWLYSAIAAGADQDISIEQTLYGEFSVSPDGGADRLLDADISGSVDYDASLVSSGIFGDMSEFTLTASLWDVTEGRTVTSRQVFNDVCPSNFPDAVCLHNLDGPSPIFFSTKVNRGHTYQIRLTARCEAHNSLSIGIQCSAAGDRPFPGPTLPADEGFVKWGGLAVTIAPDLIGQINELTLLVEQLQASLDAHDGNLSQHDQDVNAQITQHDQDLKSLLATLEGKVDENNSAILESIRLMLTPQGQRVSEFVNCDEEPGCDFPNGKDK